MNKRYVESCPFLTSNCVTRELLQLIIHFMKEASERVVDIASKLQQMWALAETAAENEFTDEQSNFDVSANNNCQGLTYVISD